MKKQFDIDWIFFDIGGVLFDDSKSDQKIKEITFDVIRQCNSAITLQNVLDAFPQASATRGNISQNIIELLLVSPQERIDAIQKFKEIYAEEVDYYGMASVRPEAREAVLVLAKDYRLGIVANQSAQAREKLIEVGILDYFSHVGISRELNLSKPDPRIFETVLRVTGADPKRSIMIDDNIERGLLPAKQFGMKVVWFDLGERENVPTGIDFRIKNLRDLLELF